MRHFHNKCLYFKTFQYLLYNPPTRLLFVKFRIRRAYVNNGLRRMGGILCCSKVFFSFLNITTSRILLKLFYHGDETVEDRKKYGM